MNEALEILNENADEFDIKEIKSSTDMSKVSIVGIGISNNAGVAATLFEVLYENNINMHMISTSEIKISVLVNSNVAETLVNAIHERFIGKVSLI